MREDCWFSARSIVVCQLNCFVSNLFIKFDWICENVWWNFLRPTEFWTEIMCVLRKQRHGRDGGRQTERKRAIEQKQKPLAPSHQPIRLRVQLLDVCSMHESTDWLIGKSRTADWIQISFVSSFVVVLFAILAAVACRSSRGSLYWQMANEKKCEFANKFYNEPRSRLMCVRYVLVANATSVWVCFQCIQFLHLICTRKPLKHCERVVIIIQ